jgi:hypothetical protein
MITIDRRVNLTRHLALSALSARNVMTDNRIADFRSPTSTSATDQRHAVDRSDPTMGYEVCPKVCQRRFALPLHCTAFDCDASLRGRRKQLMMQ